MSILDFDIHIMNGLFEAQFGEITPHNCNCQSQSKKVAQSIIHNLTPFIILQKIRASHLTMLQKNYEALKG